MESKHEIKQASWPNNFTFPRQIQNDPCPSICNLSSLCHELGRNHKMKEHIQIIQGGWSHSQSPMAWQAHQLGIFRPFGIWQWPYKLPLRLMDVQQLESVAMFHVPISNTLNFPIPKFPLISCIPKLHNFFWSCSPSPQCSWREVPLEWSYDYPSRTWDFWWDFLWNLRGSNITISTSQAGAPK